MSIWSDGFSAMGQHAWATLCILLMIVWGQIVIRKALEKTFHWQWTDAESLSLGMAGWLLPVALWAGLYGIAVFLFGTTTGQILSILLILIPFYTAFEGIKRISLPAFLLILFILVSIVLRFAFLQKAVMPSYFDSAEHYRIIASFSKTWLAGIAPAAWTGQTYYHAGYHIVGAAFSHFFQIRISDFMLVFGQVILAVLPVSLFFIVRHATGSDNAGLFACLLAGFGWHMPSHAVNWGKYPALLSLVCIHFVLLLGYILVREPTRGHRSRIYFLVGAGVLLSILVHTRTAFVFAGMAAAILAATWRKRSSTSIQIIMLGLALSILAIEIGVVQNSSALNPLLNGYWQNDSRMLILLLAILPFAIKHHADLTFFSVSSLAFFLLALFIPVSIPGFGMLTILDRPFVQMIASLPLSIIGGLGFAGLMQWTKRLAPRSNLPACLTVFSIFGFVLINAGFNQKFYPSDCCQFVSRDDLAAVTWMDSSLPSDTKILIASESLYVTSFEGDGARAGADGGIWILPLTSRQTVPAWQALDFTQPEVHASICERNLDYLYVGGMPQSFDAAQITSRPEWYRQVFALPAASVYQVTACE